MKGLLDTFLTIIGKWDKTFPQLRTANRAKSLSISLFLALGRKTLSRAIVSAERDKKDWSADYRVFSRCQWNVDDLFQTILKSACNKIEDPFIAVAYDDTLVKKTGKKIKGTSWQRDPLSPPFCVNFVWGMRYLQASILLPLYKDAETPCRAIPVQFTQTPYFKRPSKKASEKEHLTYKDMRKQYNSSTCFVSQLSILRQNLDRMGLSEKKLIAAVDGSFCNRTCMRAELKNTVIIGRTRKTSRLYTKAPPNNKQRFYSAESFTPAKIQQDEAIPFKKTSIHYGSQWREVRYKEVKGVYWKKSTGRKPLRLIVIAPTPYRVSKNSSLGYREPGYLLTTDLETNAVTLIQKFFDRWQIEVNFKEEKDLMGLGQQQVWSEQSIPKVPAFVAATYGALLLSSVLRFNDQRDPIIFEKLPKWRQRKSPRPSCLDLITLLRRELVQNPEATQYFGCIANEKNMVYKSAA